jgi:thiol-disulfide isomerase/thioredoxin
MNKNTILVIGLVAIILLGGFFFISQNSSTPDVLPTEESLGVQDAEDEEMMDDHMMMGIGYVMKDGKMMVEDGDTFSPMTEDVTLDDGTIVGVSGEVTRPDGTKLVLSEGQSMWTDGMFMDAMEMIDDSSMSSDSSGLAARYVEYSSANLAKANLNGGRAVLWFAALAWCPSCQAADRDFKANFDKVPADVTILKVDYDNDSAMKKKYSIVMQDTFIQVDSQGNEVTKWNSGGQGIKTLLANLK